MNILVDVPDEMVAWLERERIIRGIPSRRKAIIEAIRVWTRIPAPVSDTDSWPQEIITGMCPECADGQHCQSPHIPYLVDVTAKARSKVKLAYVCACKSCVEAKLAEMAANPEVAV